jgi:hypothetical protein
MGSLKSVQSQICTGFLGTKNKTTKIAKRFSKKRSLLVKLVSTKLSLVLGAVLVASAVSGAKTKKMTLKEKAKAAAAKIAPKATFDSSSTTTATAATVVATPVKEMMAPVATAAASTTSTIKANDVIPADKARKDIDEEITNAKMRAETGSKSKYSFRSSFNYAGSNLQKPLASDRPSLNPERKAFSGTSLTGSIGGKMRATDHLSVSVNAGVSLNRPFEPGNFNDEGKSEIADPGLSLDYVGKMGDLQSVSSLSGSYTTSKYSVKELGKRGDLGLDQTFIYSFKSGWDLGMALSAGTNLYASIPDQTAEPKVEKSSLGLFPFAEYAFNDMFSFRTVFRYSSYSSTVETPNTFTRLLGTQSMGIGIAATRDIYFYPNLQFVPSDLISEKTNWGLSANISL